MKIFLTGSAGFLSTHLIEKLESRNHKIIKMDNLSHPCKYHKKPDIIDNIRNIWDYADIVAECDCVVNTAAFISVEKSLIAPFETKEVNYDSAMKILDLCNKLNVPLIQSSSSEIYGDKDCEGKMHEKHSTYPKSPYAATKLAIDGMNHAYYDSYGTKVMVVRTFNCFGKYQSNNKFGAVIGIFAERLSKGLPPQIYGNGEQKRDFMGYKDAIDFYTLLIERCNDKTLHGKDWNVGLGRSISINNLAKKMIKLYGYKNMKPIHIEKRPGEVKEFLCDNTKAKALGWNPDTDFDKLLKEFIDWKKGESK